MRRTIITAILAGLVGALVATPVAVYASHSFSDVPASNTFHADIEWLRQSGVTRGCNPPDNTEFCPDDFVTREQMSAFMRRLAQYMGAEDGTPAQADQATTAETANQAATAGNADHASNADTLDGLDPTDLIMLAFADNIQLVEATETVETSDATNSVSVSVECPAGYRVIGGGAGPIFQSGSDQWFIESSNPVDGPIGAFDNDGWVARFRTDDGNVAEGTYILSAEAICAFTG